MNSVHRQPSTAPGSGNGFTLLEIMVAIFIFALVITTVFGSFRAVFSSADAIGGDVAVFETARTCLGRMATDLGALVVSDYPRYAKPEPNCRNFDKRLFITYSYICMLKLVLSFVAEIGRR